MMTEDEGLRGQFGGPGRACYGVAWYVQSYNEIRFGMCRVIVKVKQVKCIEFNALRALL